MADQNARYYGAAADYNKPASSMLPRILILVGGVVAVIIFIFIAFQFISSLTSGPKKELEQLAARQQALAGFTAEYQANISDSKLAKANSEAIVLSTSDSASIVGQTGTEVSEDALALELDTTSAALLSTARQNGRFNDEYRKILQSKIAASLQLAQSLQQKTSDELNIALQQVVANLKSIDNEL